MMRGKVYGYVALIICGVAIYLAGFARGEMQQQDSASNMYFQGYRTGYIKGFRRVRKEVQQQSSVEIAPLKLNTQIDSP